MQKKLIKNNNISLVAVNFAFIGKMIKAIEFLTKLYDCLHLGRTQRKFSEREVKALLLFLLP